MKKRRLSPAQRANHQLLSRIAKAWSDDLTELERRAWNLDASHDRKRKHHRTGFHTFIRANVPRVRVGLPWLKHPPSSPVFGFLHGTKAEARSRNGRFTLTVQANPDNIQPDWYIVAATKAGNPGQRPKEHDLIVIHPNANLADLLQLGDAYLKTYRKKYGIPQPGRRLGVSITPFTGGTKGLAWHADVVVAG